MTMPTHFEPVDPLETTLREAPAPTPPRTLAGALRSGVQLPPPRRPRSPGGWKRWWPALTSGGAAVAFAGYAWVQEVEIQRMEAISAPPAAVIADPAGAVPQPSRPPVTETTQSGGDERADFVRLQSRMRELTASAATAAALAAENARLEAAIAAVRANMPEETRLALEAQARASRIRCINNLKQLGLGVRIYASDHADDFPPDLKSIIREVQSPQTFICPEDTSRKPLTMAEWASASPAQVAAACTYEFLAPGPGRFDIDPQRVMLRCPIHGAVGLCDGSVQAPEAGQAETLERRDGRVYWAPPKAAAPSTNTLSTTKP